VAPEAEAPDFEAGYHPEVRKSKIREECSKSDGLILVNPALRQ
jgi:hypothetical protein